MGKGKNRGAVTAVAAVAAVANSSGKVCRPALAGSKRCRGARERRKYCETICERVRAGGEGVGGSGGAGVGGGRQLSEEG